MKPAVNIRMPEGMKKVLEDLAEKEFRSLNSVILQYLDEQLKARGVEWRDTAEGEKAE